MYKVLIIDDEKIIRIALKSMISWEEHGFTVCGTAAGCQSALEIMNREKPQLLILDIIIPDMDGITFVKQLRSSGYEGEIILLSNHQNFDYAREALHNNVFDYILKTEISPELLTDVLERVKALLNQRTPGQSSELPAAENEDHSLLLDAAAHPDACDCATLVSSWLFLEIFIRSRLLSHDGSTAIPKGTLNNLIQESASGTGCLILSLSEDASLLLVPENEQIRFLSSLDSLTSKIGSLIRLYMNTDCGFVCSSAFQTTGELRKLLAQLPDLESLVLYRGFETVIRASDLKHLSTDAPSLSPFVLRLKQRLTAGDYTGGKELLTEEIERLRAKHIHPHALRKSLSSLCAFLIFDNSSYLDQSRDRLQHLAARYRNCCTLDEYLFLLSELIDLIRSTGLTLNISAHREEIQIIDKCITEHIDQKLTLSFLARYINRSENYLSRLFKGETGINIIQYINYRKMEKAKELLMDPQLSINEISNTLGFTEASYFNKIFKKIYDINPSEYRKKALAILRSLDT